jgi:hypothetical protein
VSAHSPYWGNTPGHKEASSAGDDWHPDPPFIRSQNDYPGTSFGLRRINITGARPSIITQLRRCPQRYHAHVKGAAFTDLATKEFRDWRGR